jgi:hypothetical protein
MRFLMLLFLPNLLACSFTLNNPGPVGPSSEKPDCTSSYGAPVLDTIMTAAALGLFLAAASTDDGCTEDGCSGYDAARSAAMISGLVVGGVYGLSSLTGYSKVSSCQEANHRYQELHLASPASESNTP